MTVLLGWRQFLFLFANDSNCTKLKSSPETQICFGAANYTFYGQSGKFDNNARISAYMCKIAYFCST